MPTHMNRTESVPVPVIVILVPEPLLTFTAFAAVLSVAVHT
uniref:Uncharacterized protein n=1 Tax=blood disease bacterium R229 TaxID=741978 RepID=G2ZK62_9RALS|nr:hypothetical protein BDB_60032 [blood disease bacterium R229]